MRNLLDNSLADDTPRLSDRAKMTKPSLFDELIDQYKLEKHLAQNSITDLYLAYDVDENRQVAIEILLPHLSRSRTYAERFVTKMRTVSQIKHPNIAQVLQVGTTPFNNRPYVAREHVEAYPLRERLEQLAQQSSPVNSVYALKLVQQIAEALALAERLEIYHYDLQPAKIMLQLNGSIVLTDLGIPRIKNISANGKNINQDPRYWSPEQVQEKSLDPRSHVYSMGVLLYELLTGELPQEKSSLWTSVKRSPLLVGTSALEKIRTDLSPETYRLVNRALRPQQWARFHNSEAFRTAIDEAIRADEFLIRTGTVPEQGRGRRLLLLMGGLLAFIIVIGLGLLLFRGSGSENDNAQMTASIPAVAVSSPDVTPTVTSSAETAVSPSATITILDPAPRQQFDENATVTFTWNWPTPLTDGQQFVVQAASEQDRADLGTVTAPTNGTMYRLQVPTTAFPDGPGEYRWQITLLSNDGNAITQSEPQVLIITAPPTATHTPTPTETTTPEPSPTITLTPTPVPQVQVIVASASLREGPGLNYGIAGYLFEGDVVTILAIDEQDGLWYNVELTDGSELRGWLAVSVAERVDSGTQTIPRAATIPPSPTPTNTPTPTPTATFTPTPLPPPSDGGGGGSGGSNPPGPPTLTPPPP